MNESITNAEALVSSAARWGVDCIFANLGSDHPAFIEAFAQLSQQGAVMPRIIVCPHEMTALTAAHGYAMITRRPQIVLVHVDVGTQNLGGSVHNAARGRVPAVIVAGRSPVTSGCEAAGSRTEFIHYLQDTPRQHDIVAPYVKWAYELRIPQAAHEVLHRALQIAAASPAGPVYITGAREAFEHCARSRLKLASPWPTARMGGLPEGAAGELREAIARSRRPIVLTSYLGRNPEAVDRLVAVSEQFGIGIVEIAPQYVNFPGDHRHHCGYAMNRLVADADLILLVDVDVPWIPANIEPAQGAQVIHIDVDPLKCSLGYWGFPAQPVFQADAAIALAQLAAGESSPAGREERVGWLRETSAAPRRAQPRSDAGLTLEELTQELGAFVSDETLVVVESPSAAETISATLRMRRPGSFFQSGGSALGFGINAAIGAKLASPKRDVVALVGDGSFLFGVPSSAYWVARTYDAPFLTVIYNNGGWNSPRRSTLLVHPHGEAARSDRFWSTVSQGADLPAIATAAGGADALYVRHRSDLPDALRAGLAAVRAGRCAVVDVTIERFSSQILPGARS